MALHVFYGTDTKGSQEYFFGLVDGSLFVARLDIYRVGKNDIEMELFFYAKHEKEQYSSDMLLDILAQGIQLYSQVNARNYLGLSCIKKCVYTKFELPKFLFGVNLDKQLSTLSVETKTFYEVRTRRDPLYPTLHPKKKASPMSEDAYKAVQATMEYLRYVSEKMSRID